MKDSYPEYSVLMSVYAGDNPQFFYDAVSSLLNQTVKPDEIVIVVDGPVTDDINRILLSLPSDSDNGTGVRFTIYRLVENVGAGGALMQGAPLCKNEIIAIMDADDLSRPHRIEKQLQLLLSDSNLGLVGSWVSEFVDDNPNHAVSIVELPEAHEEILRFSKRRDPFRKPTVVLTRRALIESGGFNGRTPYYEDWDLFNRIIAAGFKTANVPEVLLDVRTNGEFFDRRGGLSYLKNTYVFVAEQLMTGYFSVLDAFIAFIPHAAVIMLPNRMREWIYKTFLRKAVDVE